MSAIGFSGPRAGMTRPQLDQLTLMLVGVHRPFRTLRHGDCVGADVTAASVARRLGFHIIGHPGRSGRGPNPWRGWFPSDRTFEPRPFLARNRTIVDTSVVLIATPATFTPPVSARGSGTWWTIRYAIEHGKPTYVIFPDGSMTTHHATVTTATTI